MPRDQLEIVQTWQSATRKRPGEVVDSTSKRRVCAESVESGARLSSGLLRLSNGFGQHCSRYQSAPDARHFLSQLDGIIARQQTTLQQSELQLEQFRNAWIEANGV